MKIPKMKPWQWAIIGGLVFFCVLMACCIVGLVVLAASNSKPTATKPAPARVISPIPIETNTPVVTLPPSETIAPSVPTETAALEPSETATPALILSESDAASCSCSKNAYNCGNFANQNAAQICFQHCKDTTGEDVHLLDRDNDLKACQEYQFP